MFATRLPSTCAMTSRSITAAIARGRLPQLLSTVTSALITGGSSEMLMDMAPSQTLLPPGASRCVRCRAHCPAMGAPITWPLHTSGCRLRAGPGTPLRPNLVAGSGVYHPGPTAHIPTAIPSATEVARPAPGVTIPHGCTAPGAQAAMSPGWPFTTRCQACCCYCCSPPWAHHRCREGFSCCSPPAEAARLQAWALMHYNVPAFCNSVPLGRVHSCASSCECPRFDFISIRISSEHSGRFRIHLFFAIRRSFIAPIHSHN